MNLCRRCGRDVFIPERQSWRNMAERCTGCELTVGRCSCSHILSPSAIHKVLSEDARGCEHPKTLLAQCVRVSQALRSLSERR